eukprot:3323577-Rhodomonas_salina.1
MRLRRNGVIVLIPKSVARSRARVVDVPRRSNCCVVGVGDVGCAVSHANCCVEKAGVVVDDVGATWQIWAGGAGVPEQEG